MTTFLIQLGSVIAITWTIGEIYLHQYKKKHSLRLTDES